jgi:hypothetical protein
VSLLLAAAACVLVTGPLLAARQVQKSALVTVVAETGSPILDLTGRDFLVKEDGRKMEVVEAHLATDALSIVLVIDGAQPPRSGTSPTQELRAGAAAFVTTVHILNPDARIALAQITGASVVTTVDFTNNTTDLQNAISRIYPSRQEFGVVLEGVAVAGKKLAAQPGPRRALVAVELNSPEYSADSMLQQAADSVANSGATLWAVSVRGTRMPGPNREELLNKMTKASGGKRFSSMDASGLEGMLKNVAASLSSQYIVTFTRTGEGAVKSTIFETAGGRKVLLTPFMR